MSKALLLPLAVTAALGLTGTGLVLFAWQLPPFSPARPTTENAYVRGKVTTLAPQIAGHVAEVLVSDFQQVRAGEVLIRLENDSQRAKLDQAKAGLASAEANVLVAQTTLRSFELTSGADQTRLRAAREAEALAHSEQARQRSLKDRGVLASASLDHTNVALSAATAQLAEVEAAIDAQQEKLAGLQAQLRAAEASVAREEAAVELARLDLLHTEITAPTDGQVGQIAARVGQFVSAGTALAAHVGPERWVVANFTETNFERLNADQPVTFSVDALAHREFQGHISRFSPATASEFSVMAGTNATGNFTKVVQRIPVRIDLDANQPFAEALLPGMSVIVVAR